MLLAIDAGYSFVKTARYDGQAWGAQQRVALADFCAEPSRYLQHAPPQIVIANVAGPAFQAALESALPRRALQWVKASSQACGVTNLYSPPQQLGADRWAILVATRAITQDACVVASFGTALTVDMLAADGRFLGGVIAPGLHLMRTALAQATHAVQPPLGHFTRFPTNTADALETGLVYAVLGVLAKVTSEFEAQTQCAVRCILTGGDAHFIAPYLTSAAQVEDNLVLEGLRLLARKESQR